MSVCVVVFWGVYVVVFKVYKDVCVFQTYKGAVEDLSMAIRIDNTCYFAHYNRGVCYQQLKLYHLVRILYLSSSFFSPSLSLLHL